MKLPIRHTALAFCLTTTLQAGKPVPPPSMPPETEALFNALVAQGKPDFEPQPVTRTPAEEKMDAQLGALFNPDLRVVDLAVHKQKLELRGQYQPAPTERVRVYLDLVEGADPAALAPLFTGPPETFPGAGFLCGWIEINRLEEATLRPETRFIRPVQPPHYRSGSFLTEGDSLHHGPAARTNLGLTGAPIHVGVISNGVSNLHLAQATNDLPPIVNVIAPGSGDEGTAMLELIHDIAPGASLSFCPSGTSMAGFAQAILALHAIGCDIICDDVGFYGEPFFEHSSLGHLIANLRSQRDYLHISAAGNDGQIHHQQHFTDANGDGFHDQPLIARVAAGERLDIFMGWDEPATSSPTHDFDLYLHDLYAPYAQLDKSVTTGSPGENLFYINQTTSDQDVVLWIYRSSGTLNRELEVILEPINPPNTYVYSPGISAVDSIFGHPGHGSVIAVGATDHSTPDQLEINSSQGPFTTIGMLQTPKPDCAAADGVTVSGVGGFGSPFYGTSAAAPHVAGVCALAWSRSPDVPATALANALRLPPYGASLDLPSSAPDGFDPVFGTGRPLADQWAGLLNAAPALSVPAGPFQCAQMIPKAIPGISVSDPDTTTATFTITLGATFGSILIDENIPGGIMPGQAVGNGTPSVTITAPLNAIKTTFAQPLAVRYLGNPVSGGMIQPDTLGIVANDGGASGFGGPLSTQSSIAIQLHEFAYHAWQHERFTTLELADPMVSGDDADPDGDRYINVWEYFIGGDPKVKDPPGAFSHSFTASTHTYHFRLSPEIQPRWYDVLTSTDLVNWSAHGGVVILPHPTLPGLLEGTATQTTTGAPRGFLRIEFDPLR